MCAAASRAECLGCIHAASVCIHALLRLYQRCFSLHPRAASAASTLLQLASTRCFGLRVQVLMAANGPAAAGAGHLPLVRVAAGVASTASLIARAAQHRPTAFCFSQGSEAGGVGC